MDPKSYLKKHGTDNGHVFVLLQMKPLLVQCSEDDISGKTVAIPDIIDFTEYVRLFGNTL